MRNRTRSAVIAVVTTVWVVNFGAGFAVEDYRPSDAVHAVFLLIVGYLFTRPAQNDDNGGPP